MVPRHFAHHFGGTVGRIVVDDDELERDAAQRGADLFVEEPDIFALIVARHDDG